MNSFFIGLAACMSRENYKLILQTGVLAVAVRAKNPNLSEKTYVLHTVVVARLRQGTVNQRLNLGSCESPFQWRQFENIFAL